MSGGVGTPEGFVIDPDGSSPLDLGALPVSQITNLVANPSFEYDTIGSTPAAWTTSSPSWFLNSGATITAQAPAGTPYGSQAMRVATTSSLNHEGGAILLNVLPAGTYTASAYVAGASGGEALTLFAGIISPGTGDGTQNFTATTSFVQQSVTFTSDGSTPSFIGVRTQTATAVTFYVDAVLVTAGTTLTPYIDGDTKGYKWSGTKGSSTSIPVTGWGTLRLAGLTIPPAPKRLEWASNADTDGAALVRNPYHDNRQCSMQVRVRASSMNAAMTALGTLQGKLQEACIQGANNGPGLKCNWTPAGATNTLALYIVYAEITDLPVTYADGWFANNPVVTVTFQAKPFLYGAEITSGTSTASAPLTTVEIDNVEGDVPAEARLVVTEGNSQARRWLEWGLESEYYSTSSPAPLFLDSGTLVTSGFAGAGTAETGAYGGSVVGATLYSQPLALCGTGDLPHVGTFRVKARVLSTSQAQYWRLSWQSGDGDYLSNDWTQPVTSNTDYSELDFGLVTIEPAEAGAQKWSGRVEAYTTDSSGTRFGGVDYLALIPALEGYGRMEAAYSYQAGVLTARDDFSLGTAGSALNGHAAVTGGTWATSGATTDFVYYTDANSVTWVKRATTSDSGYRYAILGTATPTNDEVGVTVVPATDAGNDPYDQAVIARWTDSSNYLAFVLEPVPLGSLLPATAFLQTTVAGTLTTISSGSINLLTVGAEYSLRLVVYASGRAIGTILDSTGTTVLQLDASSTALETGGALASGKSGIADHAQLSSAPTRYYRDFYVATPAAELVIINSGKSLEIRSDSNLRQSTDGATYGDIPSRGSRLFIPQAGDANRSSRIAVRTVREDPLTMPSRNDNDQTHLYVYYTPRYLGVPRA